MLNFLYPNDDQGILT